MIEKSPSKVITSENLNHAIRGLVKLTDYYYDELDPEIDFMHDGFIMPSVLDNIAIKRLTCGEYSISYEKLRMIISRHDVLNRLANYVLHDQFYEGSQPTIFDTETILFLKSFNLQPRNLKLGYIEMSSLKRKIRELRFDIYSLF
jgi:hypothetical protein